jgi:hypothetical protein
MFAPNSQSSPPSYLPNWEEWRGSALLLPGYPLELVQEQVPRPRHGYFVDILVDARELLPVALEPLRRFVEGRRIVIELESGQISASKFRRHLAQPLLVPPLDDPDEAVLLIICRRPPRARLGYHEAVLLEPGIWQVPRGRRGAAYIVVPGLLTRAPGYALLRGSFVSRNAAEAIERMDHFLTDPLLPSDVREALMDQIGRKEVPMSDDELDALDETFRALPPSPYRDHLIRCAKRQGRKEGRQEGRQEGQEALLNVAANLMTPSEVASLATRSLGEIAAAIAARVSALAGQQRQA